jgi:hypothetical protein
MRIAHAVTFVAIAVSSVISDHCPRQRHCEPNPSGISCLSLTLLVSSNSRFGMSAAITPHRTAARFRVLVLPPPQMGLITTVATGREFIFVNLRLISVARLGDNIQTGR